MELSFREFDVTSGGGGLEAHRCLTTATLYRAADSATTIK